MKRYLPMAAKYGGVGLLAVALTSWIACSNSTSQGAKLAAAGNYDDALAMYRQTVAEKPGSVDARQAQLEIASLQMTQLEAAEDGLATYQAVVDASPETAEGQAAGYAIGLYHFRSQDYAAASTAFRGVVQAAPTSDKAGEAQLMLAKSQEEAGNFEDALKTYGAFSQLHPDTDQALIALETRARLLDQLGRKADAIAERQRVVRDYGAKPSEVAAPVVELARQALLDAGAPVPAPITQATQSDAARRKETLDRVRDRDRPASAKRASAERAERDVFGVDAGAVMSQFSVGGGGGGNQQGTMYDAMFTVAYSRFQMEDYRAAGALYKASIEMALAEVGSGWENLGAASKALADVYLKLGLDDYARKALEVAVRRNPAVVEQVIEGGLVEYGYGSYEKALATWQSVAGMNPGRDSEIYYNMGLAYEKLKNTPAEVEHLEKSIAANPGNTDALQSLAAALYYRDGQRKRSYLYQDIVDNKSDWTAYLEVGNLALKHGYYLSAQQQYNLGSRIAGKTAEKATEAAEKKAAAEGAAGMAALKAIVRGRKNADFLPEASTELAPLVETNPENALVRYAAGLHAVDLDDVETATAEFTKAMSLTPRDSKPVHALANLHVSNGFVGLAVELYTTFLERNPRDKAVQQRRDMLQAQLTTEAPATP